MKSTASAHLATEVRQSVARFARILRVHQRESGIGESQMAALSYLLETQPLAIGALSELEGVSPPTMNRTIHELVEAGLVERFADDIDRRKVVLRVTEAGTRAVVASRYRDDAWLLPRLARLSESDRRTLDEATRLLKELARR